MTVKPDLGDAVIAFQQLVKATYPEFRAAPDVTPSSEMPLPFSICFPETGTWEGEAGWKKGLHEIAIEMHVGPQTEQSRSIAAAMVYASSFPNLLFKNPRLPSAAFPLGTVDIVIGIRYLFGKMDWGELKTIGWHWTIQVKMQSGIT